MSRPLIYLDLDRTLYQTGIAGLGVWQKVSELYPQLRADDGHDRQHEFYIHTGDAYTYDFTAHVTAIGLDADEVYRKLRATELADGRFEYDGAGDLIEWARTLADVKVLTYGVDDYQRFKASLCPSLDGIHIETTLGEKAEYLKGRGEVWLVDDKPLGDVLPENVRFIQACLDGQEPHASSRQVATTLAQVLAMLKQAAV